MAKDNTRFTHESLQDAKSIKALLAALTKGFAKGELILGEDEDELVLAPHGLMTVRLKAEREGGRSQVNLRVSWTDEAATLPKKGSLKITS